MIGIMLLIGNCRDPTAELKKKKGFLAGSVNIYLLCLLLLMLTMMKPVIQSNIAAILKVTQV
jgi:hypothetical protein